MPARSALARRLGMKTWHDGNAEPTDSQINAVCANVVPCELMHKSLKVDCE
jgi:hypothetical protein